jgi:hypothetical protein
MIVVVEVERTTRRGRALDDAGGGSRRGGGRRAAGRGAGGSRERSREPRADVDQVGGEVGVLAVSPGRKSWQLDDIGLRD